MKRLYIIPLFIGLMVSCQKEAAIDEVQQQQDGIEFKASIDSETKTSLDGKQVKWSKGDQVAIFNATTGLQKYQVKDSDDGQTTATLSYVSGSSTGTDLNYILAYYPYSTGINVAKDPLTEVHYFNNVTVPATQSYEENAFGSGSFPMLAMTYKGSTSLSFIYVFGVLRLQLKGTAAVKSITFTGNNNEYLCGAMTLNVAPGPSIQNCSISDGKTVTLDCGTSGVQLNTSTATAFNIALPAITLSKGFTAVITDTDGGTMELSTTKSQTISRGGVLKMPEKNYSGPVDYKKLPLTFSSEEDYSIKLIQNGSPSTISLEYSIADGVWQNYTIGEEISVSGGNDICFRAGISGNSTINLDFSNYYYFGTTSSSNIVVSGNILSLLGQDFQSITTVPEYCFNKLFQNFKVIVDASNLVLPAENISRYCYYYLFGRCSGLVTPPQKLPASTLADYCYKQMFYYCSALETAPQLPAESLAPYCYQEMFHSCIKLETAPELPAKTLYEYCYSSMFYACTSLLTAPELPAKDLALCCYSGMFCNCTSLSVAPQLPSTSLAISCYSCMFQYCYALQQAPVLLATSLKQGCYLSMFEGCKKLNYIKMMATDISAPICLLNWVSKVPATGTFVKNIDATWTTSGSSGIPSGWTIETASE